ncbi:unnamed protein product [Orchesella dallaii]|uniref:BTB domain-containing protein n=1 Tax=Orchesella dallaii TaxID=48710 RepID=A0ABP1PTA4_9HEXA
MLLLRDLVLETSDKKSISCHSPVLFAQGYTPKVMAGADNQEVDKKERQVVEVPEDSIITDLFLQWIYRHDDELLKSQNCAVLIRILNLACQFQILKLMGTITKLLIEKMDRDGFLWKDEDMWRLYCVISTVNEVQIVVRLKDKVRGEVQRLNQQRKKYSNTKATKLEQDGNAACTAYMDQVFFKILLNLVEKDDGVAATVKIL